MKKPIQGERAGLGEREVLSFDLGKRVVNLGGGRGLANAVYPKKGGS